MLDKIWKTGRSCTKTSQPRSKKQQCHFNTADGWQQYLSMLKKECIVLEDIQDNALVHEVVQRRQVGNTNTFIGSSARAKLNEGIDQNLEIKTAKAARKPLKTPESIEIEESMTENNSNNKWPLKHNSKRQTTITRNNRRGTQSNKQPSNKRTSSKQNKNNNSNTTENAGTELTKKNILIVGDSQIRHIDGAKLSNDHFNVTVQPLPGARIARMKSVNYTKADVVIIHAGTCNLKKQSDPEELACEIVSTLSHIQSSCKKAQVAFSGIIKRKDDLKLNAKAIKRNEIVVEKLMYSGLDFIDNNQIKYGNISRDGLHINDGGVRKLATNFSHYIRYC